MNARGDAARAGARAPRDRVREVLLPALGLVVITLAAFSPVVHSTGFLWDDDGYVTQNPLLRDAGGLFDTWFRLGSTTMYVPVVFTTLWAEYQLWGLNPVGYHLINVAFHVAAVVLIWRLFQRLQLKGAWLAAALFAIHPVMVESVAWVVELKNVQSAFFCLLALLAYFRFNPVDGTPEPARRARRRDYALAVFLFALALLSKPVVVAVAPVLLIVIWWKKGAVDKRDVLSVVPFLAMGLAAGLLAVYIEHFYGGATGAGWRLSLLERILVAGRAVWFYAAKLAWPVNLLSVYPRWDVSTAVWWQYLFPLGAAAVIGALWYWRQSLGRGPLAAVLCFGLLLSPLVGVFNVAYHLYSFVADHFQYHAAAALFALFASGVAAARSRGGPGSRRVFDAGTGAIVLVLAVLTSQHVQTFNNEKTRCLRTIEGNPRAWSAMYNLGLELKKEGNPREALHWYGEALKVTPNNPEVLNNAGVALMSLGDAAGAVRHYRQAIRLSPDYALARNNLAGALATLGDRESAIREYEAALRIKPDYPEARESLAQVLAAEGRVEDATREFGEALRVNPDDATSHRNLGVALAGAGKFDEALPHFQEALRLRPDDPATLRELGTALARSGNLSEAVSRYRESLRLEPGNAQTHNGLAMVLAWAGRPEEAAQEFQAALRIQPGYAEAHNDYGTLLASQGRVQEAIAEYEAAVRLNPDFAEARGNLGMALADTGDLPGAVQEFREAVRLDPGSASGRERLGVGLARMGRFDEAIDQFERVLQIDPGNDSARKNLELARARRGRRTRG